VTAPTKPPARRSKGRYLFLSALFFVLGVIGILVPVMPQVVFFVMSALFLSLVFPRLRRALRRWRGRYPKLDASYRKWRGMARRRRQARIRKHKKRESR
jgi:uncharacterized membrane protein YbaN (DUF454 family)